MGYGARRWKKEETVNVQSFLLLYTSGGIYPLISERIVFFVKPAIPMIALDDSHRPVQYYDGRQGNGMKRLWIV